MREILRMLVPYLKPIVGCYYGTLHICIMILGATLLLFDNNVIHLWLLLSTISVDAFSTVILHNCPLTLLERKYLGIGWKGFRTNFFKKIKIDYRCNHEYENTIELLSNLGALTMFKILLICVMHCFPVSFTFHKPVLHPIV
jgi:hypothetical protein